MGAGSALTTGLYSGRTNFLDTTAYGFRYFLLDSSNNSPPPIGTSLQLSVTKTNGTVVTLAVTNSSPDTSIPQLVSNLINLANADPQLSLPDGCVMEDFVDYSVFSGNTNDHRAEFNLRARSPGW